LTILTVRFRYVIQHPLTEKWLPVSAKFLIIEWCLRDVAKNDSFNSGHPINR